MSLLAVVQWVHGCYGSAWCGGGRRKDEFWREKPMGLNPKEIAGWTLERWIWVHGASSIAIALLTQTEQTAMVSPEAIESAVQCSDYATLIGVFSSQWPSLSGSDQSKTGQNTPTTRAWPWTSKLAVGTLSALTFFSPPSRAFSPKEHLLQSSSRPPWHLPIFTPRRSRTRPLWTVSSPQP